jgi:cell wall-associated NlpC family hydrolase
MSKHILFTATILLSLGAFNAVQAQKKGKASPPKSDVKFLDEISIQPAAVKTNDPKAVYSESVFTNKKITEEPVAPTSAVSIENASNLQFKYALLMDTEVEQLQNLQLLKVIDDWYGTRYRLGGNSKDGIDCSALMQTFFTSLYGITLPRTAREQYNIAKKISRTEIREGDLIFFNTIGGVSHVGMYLQNNKFIHASSGGGVTISDIYDEYWLKKFVAVGRIESAQISTASLQP